MAAAWVIKIVPGSNPGGPAEFQPDLLGAQPGDPLQADKYDVVSWNNTTGEDHQIVVNSPPFETSVIHPGESSDPAYVCSPPTQYSCKLHPQEKGEIIKPTTGIS